MTTATAIDIARNASAILQKEGFDMAFDALSPLIDGISDAVATQGYTHIDPSWDDDVGSVLIPMWRAETKRWIESGFEGPLPGETVLREYLGTNFQGDHPQPLNDRVSNENVSYEGESLDELMDSLQEILPEDLFDEFTNTINDRVCETRLNEAVARGIPSHVRSEFWWVPGWDGESLDDTEHVHIKGRTWNSTYLDGVLPSEGLRNLLEWVNVSSDEVIGAAMACNPKDGEVFKDTLNEADFHVEKDPSRPSLVDPRGLIDIIENAGYTHCLPTAHAHVEVGALLKLDPRLPIALPLPKGMAHIGLHDTINGAGYMDTYPGTVVIPPLSLGFGWANRGSYGIDKTYGLHRPAFYCRPENIQAPQLTAGPDDARGASESIKEAAADSDRLVGLMKAGAGSVAPQAPTAPAVNQEPVKRTRLKM